MNAVVTARAARWPWTILAAFLALATLACVFVVRNGEPLGEQVPYVVAFSMFGVVGALIASRERRNRIGWLLLWAAGVTALSFACQEIATYLALGRGQEQGALLVVTGVLGNVGWLIGILPAIFLLPILFPTGRPHSRRWRPLPWIVVATLGILLVATLFATPVFTSAFDEPILRNPLYTPALDIFDFILDNGFIFLGLLVAAGLSQVMRFLGSRGIERQQIKWFAFAVSFFVVYLVFSDALNLSGLGESIASGLAFATLPAAIGVSVLQFRLWDLEIVVKRALVAGTLVVLAIAVYAAAVAVVGLTAAGGEHPGWIFAIALALGIAFRPVMRLARRIADRIVYGRRATPYEVLTEFSERLGTSYGTEDVLPRMAQVLGEGTGAEVARVWLRSGAALRQAAVWPADAGRVETTATSEGWAAPGEVVVEVRDRGDVLGALSVRMPPAEPMNPSKEKLVQDLAAQAGLVLRNVRLVEDLRASRQRLVAAQDDERRRLERNIHDGAQQQLVALAVKARLAKQLVDREPTRAAEVLGQIERETQGALEDLRDLARGIYPPLLADEGLVAAIRAQSRKAAIDVSLEAEGIGRYPQDVEATVYFCALEALQNVAKYADAGQATVRLSQSNGTLSFAVIDRGRGFDPTIVRSGSGLEGMADRLSAVGGSLDITSAAGSGTTVAGRVPLPAA